jgi:Uma2 family endonuclease
MATKIESGGEIASPDPAALPNGTPANHDSMPIIAIDMPIMYEDEGQEEMGDSDPHTTTIAILTSALKAHLKSRSEYRVFSDLNVYYHRIDRCAYFSPDVMAVKPGPTLPKRVTSYRIGVQGPAPELAIEVLSRRSFQQQDMGLKPIIYSELGIAEYILVDVTGELMPERLQLRRLQSDGTWQNERDQDGGVTSRLGFRLTIEDDEVRVIDLTSGKRYLRPEEAHDAIKQAEAKAVAEAETRRQAQERADAEKKRADALEAELRRLRNKPSN